MQKPCKDCKLGPVSPSILQQLQEDIAARLGANSAFTYVPITVVNPLDEDEATLIQTRIDEQLSGYITKAGKAGLACLVLVPELNARNPDLPGPQLDAEIIIRVIENPLVNRGADGVQVTPEEQAMTVLGLLHLWSPYNYAVFYAAERGALSQVQIKDRIAWDVKMTLPLGVQPFAKTGSPQMAISGADVILGGPDGSQVYYTLDDSLPTATNGTLYEGPFTLTASATLRAVAVKAGSADSDVRQATILI